jgi:aquaporin Z
VSPRTRRAPGSGRDGPRAGLADADGAGLGRRVVAELVGTFALVFVAVGGDAMARLAPGEISSTALAVAPGLMVAALIYAIGDVSGAHLNPAVTLAFVMKRLFPSDRLPVYWLSQLAGAILASALVAVLFGPNVGAGVSTPHVPDGTAFVLEVVLTTLLVTVILGTADRARIVGPNAALAVGATIGLAGLIARPIEGASMNPARSLAPAMVAGRLESVWIYVAAPLVGAALAVVVNFLLHGPADRNRSAVEAAQGDRDSVDAPTGVGPADGRDHDPDAESRSARHGRP